MGIFDASSSLAEGPFIYEVEVKMPANLSLALDSEMKWCGAVIDARFDQYFSEEDDPRKKIRVEDLAPPLVVDDGLPYPQLVKTYSLGFAERLLLVLALLPHLRPQALY